jgi:uncharacterized damage-inducible protein DinB
MLEGCDLLIRAFEFDSWANEQWWECLDRKGWQSPDREIFEHLVGVQELWLRRCQGESPPSVPPVEVSKESLVEVSGRWRDLLTRARDYEGEMVVDYKRFNGEPHRDTLSDLALHVIDHGTYHRGELRGLCRSRGDEDFPETAFLLFFRE